MNYRISKKCFNKINSFYKNVAKKYKHTYSEDMLHNSVDETIDSMYKIEKELLRRTPTIEQWQGYYMANTEKWYFAYTVIDNTVNIVDACHAQNMH